MTYTERKDHIRKLFEENLEEFKGLPENWSMEQLLRYAFQRGYQCGFPDGVDQAVKIQAAWGK